MMCRLLALDQEVEPEHVGSHVQIRSGFSQEESRTAWRDKAGWRNTSGTTRFWCLTVSGRDKVTNQGYRASLHLRATCAERNSAHPLQYPDYPLEVVLAIGVAG
jgi:hypothetical protein